MFGVLPRDNYNVGALPRESYEQFEFPGQAARFSLLRALAKLVVLATLSWVLSVSWCLKAVLLITLLRFAGPGKSGTSNPEI